MKELTLTELWGIFDVFARQLKFLADICLCSEAFDRVYRKSMRPKFPIGANLMSYMYNLVLKNSSTDQFITDWLYDGICNDPYNEFFVHMDHQYLCYRDKHFWTQGFQMKKSKDSIPLFLDDLVESIFACGKAINLLKLVNIKHYLFERGFRKPEVSVTFSSVKLESIEKRCQKYINDVHNSRNRYEEMKTKKKLEEEEAWKIKIKKEKEYVKEAIRKMEDLEHQVKQAIQSKKKETFLNLKEQFENVLQERQKMKEKKLIDDQYWLDEMKKYEEKEDASKKKARDELIVYYEKLSSQAEQREFHANWIILRYELTDKRKLFMENQQRQIEEELKAIQGLTSGTGLSNSLHSESVDETDGSKQATTDESTTLSTMIDNFLPSASRKVCVDQTNPDEKDHLETVLESLKNDYSETKIDVNPVNNLMHTDEAHVSACDYDGHTAVLSQSSRRTAYGHSAYEGDNAKKILYANEKSNDTSVAMIDVNAVEGAETKNLLYPTGENVSHDVKTVDVNAVEGTETKNLLYPTGENVSHDVKTVDVNAVEGAETKNLLYPTGENVSQNVKTVDVNAVEGAETKNLLYPTGENVSHDVKTNDVNAVEGAEMKNLIYCSESVQNKEVSSRGVHIEGSPTKQLLYPDNIVLTKNPSEQSQTEDTVKQNQILLGQLPSYTVREFEKPSIVQSLLYPERHAEKNSDDEQVKRISRGFEPPTRIKHLMYPEEDAFYKEGTKKSSNLTPLSAGEVWMDSVVEPFQDDYTVMDKDPQPYLFGDTNRSIAQHFVQSEPDKDADIIRQLPLEIIIKRSLTLPIQAQITLVNSAVIKYFIEDLNIEVHFDAFRKFLLLEDGEFGHSLCSQLFKKISSGMKPQEFCNTIRLNNIIIEALRLSLYASQIEYSNQLTFSLKWIPDVFQPSDVGALDFLELRYRVPWPCNIIVTENSITKYNKVFSFLLKLKKAGWSLQEVWINLKKAGHDKKAAMSPQLRQLQLYRHEMQHFVNNLERYVVNQIIHVSWREFQHDLQNKVHSLDDLHRCHVSYLNKIIFRSLLSKNAAPVYKLINDIFGMIAKFEARLLTTPWQQDVTTGFVTHALFSKLKAVHSAFKQCGEFLFSIISKLVRRGYQDHLDDLLLQVNFNAYYTTAMVKK